MQRVKAIIPKSLSSQRFHVDENHKVLALRTCVRADFLHEIRSWVSIKSEIGSEIRAWPAQLVLHAVLKTCILSPLRRNNKGHKINTPLNPYLHGKQMLKRIL